MPFFGSARHAVNADDGCHHLKKVPSLRKRYKKDTRGFSHYFSLTPQNWMDGFKKAYEREHARINQNQSRVSNPTPTILSK